MFAPWTLPGGTTSLSTEKWLPLGFILTILAAIGFAKVKLSTKIVLTIASFGCVLIALSSTSIAYDLFVSQSWYKFIRVPTRVWFVPILISIYLAGYALNAFQKSNYRFLIHLLSLGVLIEFLWMGYSYIQKPITIPDHVPSSVYTYLKKDTSRFRVLCLTLCMSQKDAAINNLELVQGYSTLTQLNYYQQVQKLLGIQWNYYSLLTPPPGVYQSLKIQPNAQLLGDFNTKYIIAPYPLIDKNFILREKIGKYFIYLNLLFKPRADAEILTYSANEIVLATKNAKSKDMIVREVYSPGWQAYTKNGEKLPLVQTSLAQRKVILPNNTDEVILKYEPLSFKIGGTITLLTFGLVFLVFKFRTSIQRNKHYNSLILSKTRNFLSIFFLTSQY